MDSKSYRVFDSILNPQPVVEKTHWEGCGKAHPECRPISTYLTWLAEKAYWGIPVKAEKELAYASIPYLSLCWPDAWKKETEKDWREHKVMRLLLAAELAKEDGQ